MENNLSPADVFAMTNSGKDGFSLDWIILLFLFLFALGGNVGGFCGNGNGFGNAAFQNEVQRGFDNSAVIGKLDGIGEEVLNNRFEASKMGCGIERNIDALRYDGAINTTTITNAVHAEAEITRNMMRDNEIQTLRDQLQSANLTLAQSVQTQNLLNALRPFPQPAYITCSPYQSASIGYNNCGCNGVI